ncbi:MAG: YtxH domain-containing protein [Fimbriimonadales bacterium]
MHRKETFPKLNSSDDGPIAALGLGVPGARSRTRISCSRISAQRFANMPGHSAGGKIEVFIMRIGRYESSESSNLGTAITFLLIGLGAGALAGLLLAPKSGKQTRRDLQKGFEDAKDKMGDWADEAKSRVRDAGDRVRDAASRGVDMAEDLRDTVREKAEPLRRAITRS